MLFGHFLIFKLVSLNIGGKMFAAQDWRAPLKAKTFQDRDNALFSNNASNVKEHQEANLFAPKNIATHPVPALARHGDKDKVTKRDCNKERQLCGSRHHRGRAASKLLIGKDGLDICSVHDNCQNIISALRKRIIIIQFYLLKYLNVVNLDQT